MSVRAFNHSFLSSMRSVGDPLADDLVNRLFADPDLKARLFNSLKKLEHNSSLREFFTEFKEEKLFSAATELPPWLDLKLIDSGTKFFGRNANHIMQLLGLLSLPYCYAAANGAMVLYISERLRKDTVKRLADTGRFVLDVQSPGAFTDKGRGFTSILKTRITHAIARYYTLKSGRWNFDWGVPVNQQDLAGTNLAFSLVVIRGLRRTGLTIPYEDQEAFLHLWALIAYLLGIDERLIPMNGKEANLLEKANRETQFQASEQGRGLTKDLIRSLTGINRDDTISPRDVKQLMRYLQDEDVAEILGINDVSIPTHVPYLLKVLSVFNLWKSPAMFR